MLTQSATIHGTAQAVRPRFLPGSFALEEIALLRERMWRQPAAGLGGTARHIFASRWTDKRNTPRQERNTNAPNRYVIGVALRSVRTRIGHRAAPTFEGILPAGTIHVTGPHQTAEAEFSSPCDFVHFYVTAAYLRDRQADAAPTSGQTTHTRSLHDVLIRDELAAHLSRTLITSVSGVDPYYVESVGQTILMRVLAARETLPRRSTLPKWRLRRVQEYLAAHLSSPIGLADLARAAGLSRMHFAAQFRAATGCKPHDFVLQHRIEAAMAMLADTDLPLVEVALNVGFQTQSHFTSVFKRLTGETPARWRNSQHQKLFLEADNYPRSLVKPEYRVINRKNDNISIY